MQKVTTGKIQTDGDYQQWLDEPIILKEAADFVKVPERTMHYLISTDQIYFSRIGKRGVRFTRRRLLDWLKKRENVAYRLSKVADGMSG